MKFWKLPPNLSCRHLVPVQAVLIILKMLNVEPTAALFGAGKLRSRVGSVITWLYVRTSRHGYVIFYTITGLYNCNT